MKMLAMCGNCVTHWTEQLQLYVEESFPRVSIKFGLVGKSTADDWHLHFVHWVKTVQETLAWSWGYPHTLDSVIGKPPCKKTCVWTLPFEQPYLNILHLWKLEFYVSDGDKAHRDKRGHLEAIIWHVTVCQYPPIAKPCTLNPRLPPWSDLRILQNSDSYLMTAHSIEWVGEK